MVIEALKCMSVLAHISCHLGLKVFLLKFLSRFLFFPNEISERYFEVTVSLTTSRLSLLAFISWGQYFIFPDVIDHIWAAFYTKAICLMQEMHVRGGVCLKHLGTASKGVLTADNEAEFCQ